MTNSTASGAVPRWDLSNIYPSLDSPELKTAMETLTTDIAALETFLDDHRISRQHAQAALGHHGDRLAGVIGELLDRGNALLNLSGRLNAYLMSFITTDSYNATAKRLYSELQMATVRLQQATVRVQGWSSGWRDALPQLARQEARVNAHLFYLQEMAEQSQYMMGEPEETLAAELSLSGSLAWSKLQGTVTSQLSVQFERNGKTEKLTMPAIINLSQHDPDGEVRRRAYETEIAAWEGAKEPLAAALNGVKGAVNTLNRKRGRRNALHPTLDANRIDQPTLEAMLDAMRESFPAFRRYWKSKAKRLGKDQLPWWDLFAPVGRYNRHYTFAEAQALLVNQFGQFSPRLAAFTQRAFDQHWIDAEMRDGKRGGAFCMGISAVDESRILCNYDGSLDQVFTIAHELGHAFHNECMKGKQPLQRQTPMTLAETASIFCETIITEAALAHAASDDEKLAILETKLIGDAQVIVDIYSRYLFESEVFERRATAELTAEDFCDIMLRAQQAAYGDGLDPAYRHQYMWTWKPHYYYASLSFYNYPYAFGLLFGAGLYAIYQQRGASFVPHYEQLLASTGEGSAADLAARFGIDIRHKQFWADSLNLVESRIDQYVAL